MYVDGMNVRRIARTLGVAHRSVINWVNAHAAQVPERPPVPADDLEVNELDELFTTTSRLPQYSQTIVIAIIKNRIRLNTDRGFTIKRTQSQIMP